MPTQAVGTLAPQPIETVAFANPERILEIRARGPRHAAITVADGDTLLDILMRAGTDRADATAALAALRRVYDPRTLKVGQTVDVELGPATGALTARPLETVALSSEPGRRVATSRSGEGFAASANKLPEIREIAHVAGDIKNCLFESAVEQGMPAQVLSAMIAAYSYDVDFQRDLQPGDGFEVMYERTKDSQGGIVRQGELIFADLVLQGRHLAIYRYTDATGQVDFYNAKGLMVNDGVTHAMRFAAEVKRSAEIVVNQAVAIARHATIHVGNAAGQRPVPGNFGAVHFHLDVVVALIPSSALEKAFTFSIRMPTHLPWILKPSLAACFAVMFAW